MRAFVYVVVFLAAVFARVTSLQCEVCQQAGPSGTCSGNITLCPADVTHCVQWMVNLTFEGGPTTVIASRMCGDSSVPGKCGQRDFVSSTGFFLGSYYDCCNTDGCNNGTIKGLYEVPEPNDYECPTCFTRVSPSLCTPTQMMNCSGNQDQCIVFNVTGTGPAEGYFSVQGCTSPTFCIAAAENVKCTPANKRQ